MVSAMSDEPKITIDDLLARPPMDYERRVGLIESEYFDRILFGHVRPFRRRFRRRFDPRRLTDRWHKAPTSTSRGSVVYEAQPPGPS